MFWFAIYRHMRKTKYTTKQEKDDAQRKWALEYYYRNLDECKKKRMKRYYEKCARNVE